MKHDSIFKNHERFANRKTFLRLFFELISKSGGFMSRLIIAVLVFVFAHSFSTAQVQRNPLLEYVTGTWCQWCPCGHSIIANEILPAMPNTIVIGYHGPSNSNDPYRNFQGNNIISLLGFSSYPTGIVDRTSPPISRSAWKSTVQARQNVPATVEIMINKTYNETTRELNLTVFATALENLSGIHFVNIVITEDNLKYSQTGNSSCTGGTNYNHNHVVRGILNDARGDTLNTAAWNQGVTITKQFTYSISTSVVASEAHLAVFVYKEDHTYNTGQIAQAEKWTLIGTVLPVELTSFTAETIRGEIVLNWATASEMNNFGFEVERSLDGINFNQCGFIKGAGTTTEKKLYRFSDKISDDRKCNYFYRLKQIDLNGEFDYSNSINVLYDIPLNFSLSQNFPNPFNPSSTIEFTVASKTFVTLEVYDMLGSKVASLVNEVKEPGTYNINFNAVDLASGIYVYKFRAGSVSAVRKMSFLK